MNNNPWIRFAMIVSAWDDLVRSGIAVLVAWCRWKYADLRLRREVRRVQKLVARIQADPRFKSPPP